jgi:hypothetical protein
MVIPDTQVKPGTPIEHLEWAGKYAAYKKPDRIIMLGDFADLPSLSSYDVGKKEFEGRTYKADIDYARKAMDLFMAPIHNEQQRLRRNKERTWNPTLVLTLGNHEDRIDRAISHDRKLEGLISSNDLGYAESGWTVLPYLAVHVLDGVSYSHYFTSGVLGRPVSSARALLTKRHCSAVMGHVQRRDIAYDTTADGRQLTAIFGGIYYQHDEKYLGPQGNKCWRGLWMLHNVINGEFDEMPVSMEYLRKKYGSN